MKLYLSSYRLGNHAVALKRLAHAEHARVAVIVNAVDNAPTEVRNDVLLRRELQDMHDLGFSADEVDLRAYFGKDGLLEKLQRYDIVWVSGGNTFLLAKAYAQSGFDAVIEQLIKPGKLVYAGYSAAFCVISPSLRGVELVDDPTVIAEGYNAETIWDSYGLIDFYPIVHFRSSHHESKLVEKEYNYVRANDVPYKTFQDGDVYVVDGLSKTVLRANG
ncbi:MAG TPA: Type 1 glutamine amidotransferase-like domain-containing protein [Patescibacteria group bacterium]|nr:Type 1 glutamine amidotransferase-like domain-containing protein [Patescibacteria group bacterium]